MQVRLLMTTVLLLEFALFGIAYHLHGVIDSGSRRVIHDSCWWFLVGRPTDHPIRQLIKTNQNKNKIVYQLFGYNIQQFNIRKRGIPGESFYTTNSTCFIILDFLLFCSISR
jgi:hypothetical protein